jgi:hypothetical protein
LPLSGDECSSRSKLSHPLTNITVSAKSQQMLVKLQCSAVMTLPLQFHAQLAEDGFHRSVFDRTGEQLLSGHIKLPLPLIDEGQGADELGVFAIERK